MIRHQSTNQFRAIVSLCAERRWCLTGTPIQNRLEDFGSLVKFLHITPFNSNANFRKHITEPLITGHRDCDQNLRRLLGSICLRRTNNLLELADTISETVILDLSVEEEALYSRIIEDSKRAIDDSISSKSVVKAYNGVFQAILRLRLLCNHGTIHQNLNQIPFSGLAVDSDRTLSLLQEGSEGICALCSCEVVLSDKIKSASVNSLPTCSHLLCSACLPQNEYDSTEYQQRCRVQCPICHQCVQPTRLVKDQNSRHQFADSRGSPFIDSQDRPTSGHSSKLSGLLNNIENNIQGNKRYSHPYPRLGIGSNTDIFLGVLSSHVGQRR